MSPERLPVLTSALREQRRGLLIWGPVMAAVTAVYISYWPWMSGDGMVDMLQGLPEGLIKGMGYDRISTPGGYITSTVYGLLAPGLLLVYSIAAGARLLAGTEGDGTLELELTAPVDRRRVYLQRLAALWICVTALVLVVGLMTLVMVAGLDMDVLAINVLAGSLGFLLLLLGMCTLAFAIGAATGRRSLALGGGSAVAVTAFMFNGIGSAVGADWMIAVSPFSWYLANNPLDNGFDVQGLMLLSVIPVVAAVVGLVRFERRDLMV